MGPAGLKGRYETMRRESAAVLGRLPGGWVGLCSYRGGRGRAGQGRPSPAGEHWSCPPLACRVSWPGRLEVSVPDTGTLTAPRDYRSIKIQHWQKREERFKGERVDSGAGLAATGQQSLTVPIPVMLSTSARSNHRSSENCKQSRHATWQFHFRVIIRRNQKH